MSDLKIKQTASEMWTFLRLLPFLIGRSVPVGNENWINFISFLDLLDRLSAPRFSEHDLVVMKQLIVDFFQVYLELYPDENLKPKAQFLTHYPDMIRKYGPLMKTLRFESKNGQLKDFIKNTKNYKHICQTLASKHQMLMYLSYKNDFLLEDREGRAIYTSEKAFKDLSEYDKNLLITSCGIKDDQSTFSQAKAIYVDGQRYTSGESVLLSFTDDEYNFGMIEKVLLIHGLVYLYCNILETEFYEHHLHAYQVNPTGKKVILKIKDLLDYHPLAIYEMSDLMYTVLRYHIPHDL